MKTIKIKNSFIFYYEYTKPINCDNLEKSEFYRSLPFMEQDAFGVLEEKKSDVRSIISIAGLVIKDDKADILKEFVSANSDKVILYKVPLIDEDKCRKGSPEYLESEKMIYNTAIILEDIGFKNINEYCQFENSIPFIYKNEAAKSVIDFVIGLEVLGHFSKLYDIARTDGWDAAEFNKPDVICMNPSSDIITDPNFFDNLCEYTKALLKPFLESKEYYNTSVQISAAKSLNEFKEKYKYNIPSYISSISAFYSMFESCIRLLIGNELKQEYPDARINFEIDISMTI